MTNEQRAIEALRELIMLGGLFDKVRAGHGATYTTVEPVLELMAHPDTIYRRLPAAMSEARSALAAVDAQPKYQTPVPTTLHAGGVVIGWSSNATQPAELAQEPTGGVHGADIHGYGLTMSDRKSAEPVQEPVESAIAAAATAGESRTPKAG